MKKFVHVCLTPALIDQYDVSRAVVVVIDVLRATTSMCVGFEQGAELIIPLENIDEAPPYKERGYLIAGERNGEQLDGFDMGNSPFSFMEPRIQGAKIAMTTTNGTKSIKAAQERGAKEVLIGSFANITSLTKLLHEWNENVVLLCAGWKDHPNLEDTTFAGAMVHRLTPQFRPFQDTAVMAEALFTLANIRKRYYFRNSSHYQRLVHMNLQEEVKYCLRRDTHPSLPMLVGDTLYDISKVADIEKFKSDKLAEQLVVGLKPRTHVPKNADA